MALAVLTLTSPTNSLSSLSESQQTTAVDPMLQLCSATVSDHTTPTLNEHLVFVVIMEVSWRLFFNNCGCP